MKFKIIEFKEDNSQKIYNDYINSIKKATKLLSDKDRREVLMEFNSHIYENMQKQSSKTEFETLSDTIRKLGNPKEVLHPLIADKSLEKATKTFHPVDILRALILNIKNGVRYIVFSLLYLLLGSFVFLIFAKIFRPANVGLFTKNEQFKAFGISSHANDYQEILGYWFIPLMLLLIVVFYLSITLLLRLKKSTSKRIVMKKIFLLTIILLFSQIIFAQKTIITPEKQEEITNYIKHFEENKQLMGNVCVFQNGKSILNINFGHNNHLIDNIETRRYTIGSITKLFVGVLFAKLKEEGQIKYKEKLNTYFPTIPNAEKIELGHMLNHTSGLKDYTSKNDSLHFWLTTPRSKQAIMNEIIHQGVGFQPKEKVEYSNTAYYLLARILEQKHQQSFQQIIANTIYLNSRHI